MSAFPAGSGELKLTPIVAYHVHLSPLDCLPESFSIPLERSDQPFDEYQITHASKSNSNRPSLYLPQLAVIGRGSALIEIHQTDDTVVSLVFPIVRSTLAPFARYLPARAIDSFILTPENALIQMNKSRLLRTAHELSMPDAVDDSPGCRLHHPSDIPIASDKTDYIEIFRALFLIINSHQWDSAVLGAIRMDELIYRQVVLLLHSYNLPDKKIQHQGHSFKYQLIDELCNKLSARLHLPITLPEIENLSGISARGLQYAFQERFGCSPMAWLREQRLLKARTELMQVRGSVMEIAVRCGFGSVSLFTRYYTSRFGETPSTTLKKSRS